MVASKIIESVAAPLVGQRVPTIAGDFAVAIEMVDTGERVGCTCAGGTVSMDVNFPRKFDVLLQISSEKVLQEVVDSADPMVAARHALAGRIVVHAANEDRANRVTDSLFIALVAAKRSRATANGGAIDVVA